MPTTNNSTDAVLDTTSGADDWMAVPSTAGASQSPKGFDPTQSIIDAANQYGVDPDFALKIAHQESGINPNVRDSSAGAMGIMQLMPGTAKDLGVDPRDPVQNIQGGVRYLRQMQDQFGNNPALVAAAYNAGPGRMQKVLAGQATLPVQTANYIQSVTASPISAKALGYTSTPAAAPTAQAFAQNPTVAVAGAGAMPPPPPGFVLDDAAPAPTSATPPSNGADAMPPPPPGFVLDGAPPPSNGDTIPPPPPGFVLDGAQPAAKASAGADDWTDVPTNSGGAGAGAAADDWVTAPGQSQQNTPPKDNSWSGAMQRVWDNPTPGGLVSIVKGIYTGLKGGAELTRNVMQTGDMSDNMVPQVAQVAMDTAPLTGGSTIRPVYQLASKAAPSAVDAAVQAAERIGVTVPKYMATDGSVAPLLAQGAKIVPWGGAPIVNAANQTRSQLADAINTIAPQTAPDVAGAAAKDAITQNIKVDAPAEVSALYGKLEGGPSGGGSLTDPTVKVPLTNTMQKMQDLQSARANANLPEWSPNMKILAQAVTDPQGMNYAGIKQLRSYLGQGAPQTLIAEGVNPQEARQLYGPLTEDLKNAVYMGGGAPALNDFTDANALAAANAAQRKQLYKIIGAKGDVAPEAVFSRLTQLAGTRSTADIALLQQAKTSMGPQAWGQVGNAIISRLGRDPQGNFSPDRFIGPNGYASLSPSAKSILFTPQQRSSLDDLNTVSNLVNSKITKFSNPSGTAHTMEAASLLGGLAHPVGTIASLAGARLAATALARPAISKAAANLGRTQLMGASTNAIMARRAALAAAIRAELPTAGQLQ